jgi:hypothetical protein
LGEAAARYNEMARASKHALAPPSCLVILQKLSCCLAMASSPMAASQVAPRLSPKDNRVVSVAKQLAALPICPITLGFYARYREPFHLGDQLVLEEFETAFRGASEPLRSKDKEQGEDKDLGKGQEQFRSGEEERLAPTRASDGSQDPYEPRSTIEECKRFLVGLGVPPNMMETALQRLMREALFPCDVEEWKAEALAVRGVA